MTAPAFPDREGKSLRSVAAEDRAVTASTRWEDLLDHTGAYVLFNHALLPLQARIRHNLLVEFEAETHRSVEDVLPFLVPTRLFGGLPDPFDRMLWRCPADLWTSLYPFLCSVAAVNESDSFYASAVPQSLPVELGPADASTPVNVVFFAVASTEGTYHMMPTGGSSPYRLQVSPASGELLLRSASL